MPRKTKQLAVRDEFLILTNGKRTEKNYFEAVRSNYKSISSGCRQICCRIALKFFAFPWISEST